MNRNRSLWLLVLLLVLLSLLILFRPLHAQTSALTPSDVSFVGYYDVQTDGNDSSWGQALTNRYVNGELRFLTLSMRGALKEFRLGAIGFGGKTTEVTGSWDLNGTQALNNFVGLWYEQAKNRLWVTSAEDYVAEYRPTNITTMTLGANGTVSNVHRVSLQGVNAKHVYGGALRLSDAVATALHCGPYVVGFGGYTSLVAQGGGASIGPTAYCIPDPDSLPNGAEIPTSAFRVLLDATSSRGVRKTLPVNYFDSGDPRQNPPTRPTDPPLATAGWQSPNAQGLGWMTWGDSAYNTGMWIVREGKTAFAMVWSMVKGAGWYQSSTLEFDGRQFELHLWDPATLGNGPLTRPTSMTELVLPRGDQTVWGGNAPIGNIAGATYDETTGRMYLLGIAHGPDVFTNRLYVYQWGQGGTPLPVPTPTPTPVPTPVPTPTPTPVPVPTPTTPVGPAGFTFCALENGVCVFTGTKEIAYGAGTTFVNKTVTGGTPCTNAVFGDPISGTQKACFSKDAVTPTPLPPPVNPCVALPGVLKVTGWPSSSEGSRRLDYSYTVANVTVLVKSYTATISPDTLTVVDSRGCSTKVTR